VDTTKDFWGFVTGQKAVCLSSGCKVIELFYPGRIDLMRL